jgi:hypothetical protein
MNTPKKFRQRINIAKNGVLFLLIFPSVSYGLDSIHHMIDGTYEPTILNVIWLSLMAISFLVTIFLTIQSRKLSKQKIHAEDEQSIRQSYKASHLALYTSGFWIFILGDILDGGLFEISADVAMQIALLGIILIAIIFHLSSSNFNPDK